MQDLYEFIKAVRVPTATAFYILHRIEIRLDNLTAAVLTLPSSLRQCPYSTTSKPPAPT